MLRKGRYLAKLASADKTASIVPPLQRRDLISGCRFDSEYPSGIKVAGSTELNRLTTSFDCGSYTASIEHEDLSRPLESLVQEGFHPSQLDAVINGGAVRHVYRRSPDGRVRVTVQWVGAGRHYLIVLLSDTVGLARLSAQADSMLNALTLFNSKHRT
ncbi:hypothetical protein GCM10011380_18970 [Sphingomonas metalli]|uniref:Uncharacterized protein n=1 Tax=Sphingomonas metalli TaxID=1779358 RepID=A0A916T5R3_9SPHN|nr:hypothetical protein GCM10011380_18970 [Sphingomonas metalli]